MTDAILPATHPPATAPTKKAAPISIVHPRKHIKCNGNNIKTEVRETNDGRGQGLYATKSFRKRERIGKYVGTRRTVDQLNEIYGKGRDTVATYAIKVGTDTVLDDCDRTGPIAYANDPVDLSVMHALMDKGWTKHEAYNKATDKIAKNAMMSSYGGNATLYSTKHIEPGEEILWSYGVDYWMP